MLPSIPTTVSGARLRARSERGATLVVAMTFIVAFTIMVVGSLKGMTGARTTNIRHSVHSDLVYSAIGFARVVAANTEDGTVNSSLDPYHLDTGTTTWDLTSEWSGATYGTIGLQWRIELTGNNDDQLVTVRATRNIGGTEVAVQVTVEIEYLIPFPYNGYFGNDFTIGPGLTTNTPIGIKGDVTDSDTILDGEVVHNADVSISGSYDVGAVPGGSGDVIEDANVPDVDLDIADLIADLTAEPDLAITRIDEGDSGLPGGPGAMKGIRLRFDPAYPDSVFVSTTSADISAVNQPFSGEVEWDLTPGSDGVVLLLDDWQNVVVEGQYSHPTTIITGDGAITIGADLTPVDSDIPAIGLVAGSSGGGTHEGNVYVRRQRNANDFGFSNGQDGVVEATIYSAGAFGGFSVGGGGGIPNSITFNGTIVAKDGGDDLTEIASNRELNGPINGDVTPPGMTRDRFVTTLTQPRLKAGSWGINYE